jgi:hypothetical protein
MAQILRKCAVQALDSAHVGDDVDLTRECKVFEEKVRSKLCKADVVSSVLIGRGDRQL